MSSLQVKEFLGKQGRQMYKTAIVVAAKTAYLKLNAENRQSSQLDKDAMKALLDTRKHWSHH